jgi:surface antigen
MDWYIACYIFELRYGSIDATTGDQTIAIFLSSAASAIMMPLRGKSCAERLFRPARSQPVSDKMRSLSLQSTVSLLFVTSLLAGCNTVSKTSAGSGGLLSPRPSASAAYITALQGGIAGRTGAELSISDRSRALEAEYRALEATAGGQTIAWKGDDASGEVIANAPFQVGAQNCRQYRHTVTVKGKDMMARGAACRNADGTWTPLT